MTKHRRVIKIILTVLIVGSIIYFFYKQLQSNWDKIKGMNLLFNPVWIALSVVFMVAFYLLTTYYWQLLINSHKTEGKLNFKSSFAIMNISSLTKYLPGRIWAYAIQIYLLKDKGYNPSIVLFDNMVLLIFTLATPLLIFIEYYIVFLKPIGLINIILAVIVILIYSVCLFCLPNILKFIVYKINKIFRRDIQYKYLSRKLIFLIQGLTIFNYFLLILSVTFLCPGINLNISMTKALQIGIYSILSSTIGFLTFITPGGLGIQEATMFGLITNYYGTEIALIIPIIIRIVQMLIDLGVGVFALLAGKEDIQHYYENKKQIHNI